MELTRTVLLNQLMISWIVITIVLVALVVYRATLSSREDDQIFIIARISRLTKPIIALSVLSGALLLASASVWIYSGFMSF
jgi:hypothetical protein